MEIVKAVNPRFESFIFDWDYTTYLMVGGYGSSKSYHVGLKIILKCFEEVRKVLILREVYDTIRESCFDLLLEILAEMDMLEEGSTRKKQSRKVIYKTSPMQLIFPNGSKIIFKGMDKPTKLKSINGVSIVWFEECSEVKYAGYKEIRGRLRHPTASLHFICSTNPVSTDNWVYRHFFKRLDDDGKEIVTLDDNRLYEKKTIIKKGVYYHHSVADDNLFLPASYIKELDSMKEYDLDLYRVAREGRFGLNGTRVLPQFEIAASHRLVMNRVKQIPRTHKFIGMDYGFEESFNAVIRMAVDDSTKTLYIYKEFYRNHMTDDQTAAALLEWDEDIQNDQIIAESAEPKTNQYFRQQGFKVRKTRKISRLEQVKKTKRFKRIVCSPECINTIRELQNLTYKRDPAGNIVPDEFTIDPHTLSAIWYGLDTYTVADIKARPSLSRHGG